MDGDAMTETNAADALPTYDELFQPVIDALSELGGSGRPTEVRDLLVDKFSIPAEALEATLKNGTQLFLSRVNFARLYLAWTGYIGSSKRGVWSLTEKGSAATIDDAERRRIVTQVIRLYREKKKDTGPGDDHPPEEPDSVPVESVEHNYREKVRGILQSMPPAAFERLCQRLLREAGFEKVVVTRRSGDGGIDGHGVLVVNHFVSFRVLFQCKRYTGSVGAPIVRDFRGAMMGRAEKGIILTTGTFTQDAQTEANRDGVPPIELVDGDNLISLFESLEFGLRPIQTFEVDDEFFAAFQS